MDKGGQVPTGKLDSLKNGTKEDKKVVAGTVAGGVMLFLFLAWAFFFFHKIINGQKVDTAWGPQKDILQFTNSTEAQQALQKSLKDSREELQQIRDEAANERVGAQGVSGGSASYDLNSSNETGSGFGN